MEIKVYDYRNVSPIPRPEPQNHFGDANKMPVCEQTSCRRRTRAEHEARWCWDFCCKVVCVGMALPVPYLIYSMVRYTGVSLETVSDVVLFSLIAALAFGMREAVPHWFMRLCKTVCGDERKNGEEEETWQS